MKRLKVLFFIGVVLLVKTIGAQPTSVSYKNLITCFPELKQDSLARKVDLNQLKEIADKKFPNLKSTLIANQIDFLDSQNAKKRIMLKIQDPQASRPKYTMELFSIDKSGAESSIAIPLTHRNNPSDATINSYLNSGQSIVRERSYIDTKLNNKRVSYKEVDARIVQWKIIDVKNRRTVDCEDRTKLGIICSCDLK